MRRSIRILLSAVVFAIAVVGLAPLTAGAGDHGAGENPCAAKAAGDKAADAMNPCAAKGAVPAKAANPCAAKDAAKAANPCAAKDAAANPCAGRAPVSAEGKPGKRY